MFEGKGNQSREPVLLVHIGSASIGAALATIGAEKPIIHYTTREILPFQESMDFARFSASTFSVLESVLKKAIHEGVQKYTDTYHRAPHIKRVGLILSSTWYVSKTLILKYEKEAPFVVTQALITSIVDEARKGFEKDIEAGKYAHIGNDAVVLEQQLIDITLNGYSIEDPFHKTANQIRVSMLISLVSSTLYDRLFKAADTALHSYSLHPHSFGLTAYAVVRDFYPTEHSFLLVDIDGEVTDVSLIRDDVLTESVSFPCGRYSVLRCLGEDAGPVEVRAKLLQRDGSKASSKAQAEWMKQYTEALTSLGEHVAIPHTLFLSGNPDVLPWFTDILSSYEGKEGVFLKPKVITPLSESIFQPHYTLEKDAHFDVFLTILALFFNKAKHQLH